MIIGATQLSYVMFTLAMSFPQSFVAVRVYVFSPGVSEAVKDTTPFRKVNGITLPFFVITICDADEQLIAVNEMFAVF